MCDFTGEKKVEHVVSAYTLSICTNCYAKCTCFERAGIPEYACIRL